MLACSGFDPDLSDLVQTGGAQSPVFAQGLGSTVFSTATVYANARMGAASWKRVMRPILARCLTSLLVEGGSTRGLDIRTVSSGTLGFPHVAPRTAAFRIVVDVASLGLTVRVTIDLIALGRDRAESDLFAVSIENPPSAPLERRLARALSARLRG